MKKVLFIDRDGTLVIEPPITYQVDTFEQLEFYPGVMRHLGFIRSNLDFEFALVSNQDGLGKPTYPQERFDAIQRLIMQTLEGEGIIVRNRNKVALCGNCLRITIGTPEENEALLHSLSGFRGSTTEP